MKKLALGSTLAIVLTATPVVNGQSSTVPCPVANSATAVCRVNVPEPGTLPLLASGLVVLVGVIALGRKRFLSGNK